MRHEHLDPQRYDALIVRLLADTFGNDLPPDVVDDYKQDVWVRAIECYDQYDPAKGEFSTWLGSVVRTTAKNASRKHNQPTDPEGNTLLECQMVTIANSQSYDQMAVDIDRGENFVEGADIAAERLEEQEMVFEFIRSLPPRQREVATMFYIDGLTYEEIADRTGLAVKTVDNYLALQIKRKADEFSTNRGLIG